jgi:hypothetical protein
MRLRPRFWVPLAVTAVLAPPVVLNGLLGSACACASKEDTAKAEIGTIQNGLKLFYTRTLRYPSTAEGLQALVEVQIIDKTLDPWGRPYGYRLDGNKPVLWSLGADGAPGGEGEDGDITTAAPRVRRP